MTETPKISVISPKVMENTEKLRKLMDGLNNIPDIHLNREEIRSTIEEGRR